LVLSLPISARTVVGAGIVLLAWGVFTWAFNPPIQSLLVQIGGERAGLLVSLNASAIYLGAGIGGALGGLVINLSGPLTLPFVSGGLSVVGLVLGLTLILGRNKARSSDGDREKVVSRAA
jgi:predicted MFS family arabinose efflux permease